MRELAMAVLEWLRARESVKLDGRPVQEDARVFLVELSARHELEVTVRLRVRPSGGRARWWKRPDDRELRELIAAAGGEGPGERGWLVEWEAQREEVGS